MKVLTEKFMARVRRRMDELSKNELVTKQIEIETDNINSVEDLKQYAREAPAFAYFEHQIFDKFKYKR